LKFLARKENSSFSNKGFGDNEREQPVENGHDSSEDKASINME
jgi:hypothetical protein